MKELATARIGVAVVIPCLNEARSIFRVVSDFKRELPDACVIVIDNGSTDGTSNEASLAGAVVVSQSLLGKGNAMRKAFAMFDADVFVMVDGDGTYDHASVREMTSLIQEGRADLVIANRRYSLDSTPQRKGHIIGNKLFSWAVRRLFALKIDDVLSGYRAMSRRFVKSFPMMAQGFEVEVELTAHASLLRVEVEQIDSNYFNRHESSSSKLRTFRDGFKIAHAVFRIYRAYAPARFFGSLSALCLLAAVVVQTHLITQTPMAEGVSIGLVVNCVVFFAIGVVLNSHSRIQRQLLRLAYIDKSSAI